MGKRKAAASSDSDEVELVDEEEELSDLEPEDDVSEEEEKPKKKPRKKPAAPRKPKAEAASGAGAAGGSAAKAPARGKKKGGGEPYTDARGWNVVPPNLLWKDYGTTPSAKIAAFDLDDTLVMTKSHSTFPTTADDWRWWNKKAAAALKALHGEGYKLVLFTNQGGIKAKLDGKMAEKVAARVDLIAADLAKDHPGVAFQVFVAPSMEPGDAYRKPATGMWAFMADRCNGGVVPDLSKSFFCGDADGSNAAHSDSDKKFAAAVGVEFRLPADVLGPREGKGAFDKAGAKAALAELRDDDPNAELVAQFQADADDAAAEADATGEQKYRFKAATSRRVAGAVAAFGKKVTEQNVKELGALPGIGKGSVDKVKAYLKTGFISDARRDAASGGGAAGGGGGAGPSAAAGPSQPAQPSKAAQAAMQFM